MDEFDIRELLKKTSYPFLAAYENKWIDADGKTHSFDEMGKKYLKNCYKYLQEQKENIERGIFLQGIKFDRNQYKNIMRTTMELYNKKINELKEYIG